MTVPNNKDFGCFLQLIFILIFILAGALACASVWPKNGFNIDYKVQVMPTPKPTATPNPIFTILVEKARADARSQATDDEIRLRWNIHFMRRFWAYFAVPVGFVVAGLGLYMWGLRYGRE